MGKNSFFGGLAKFTLAAAAVTGICYMFKDEIKSSKAYQDLDVDNKIQKAKTAIKDTTTAIKEKAQEKAPWLSNEESIIDDNEIILDDAAPSERDYVSLDSDGAAYEAAAEAPADEEAEAPADEDAEAPVTEDEEPVAEDEELVTEDTPSDNDADTILM